MPTLVTVGGTTRYTRAARLITPIVLFGTTYRSIIEESDGSSWWGYLSTADLRGWDNNLDKIWLGFKPSGFPWGYAVEPDSP